MSLYYKKTTPLIKRLLLFSFPILSNKELDKLLENYPKLLESVPDKNEIVQLKILLFFLNTRIGSSLFFKGTSRVEKLSNEKVLSFFEENLKSKVMLRRKAAFNILSILGVLITRSNSIATKKLWDSMRYDCDINQSSYKYKSNKYNGEEVDVAVIGSGAGGGVAAGIISSSGRKVAIFEKSKELIESKSSVSEGDAYSELYESSGLAQARGSGALLLAGSTLGGGTTINWTTSFEPPKKVREQWDKIAKIENIFTSDEFSYSIQEVLSRINVNNNSNVIPLKEKKLKEGLESLNISTKSMARNVKGCDGNDCGFCGFGCIKEAKQSTKNTWIEDAKNNGSDIYTDVLVDSLNITKGRATSINIFRNNRKETVEVNDIILSSGALNTPNILRKSGYRNRHLGNNLKLHPVSGVIAEFNEVQNPWLGSMQGIYSDDFLYRRDNYGYIIEGLPLHPGLFIPFFSSVFSLDRYEFFNSYPNWTGAIVLTSDSGGGKVRYNNKGPVWHYKLNRFDNENLLHGLRNICRAYEAAGAKKIVVSSSPNLLWSRDSNISFNSFIEKINNISYKPYNLGIGSAHQMGSARIGVDKETGVCDENGKVHGLENVYIMDSSTFPRCSGVNPMISIESISHYLSTKFINQL